MSKKGGACMAAPGARIPHEKCRWAECPCDCGHNGRDDEGGDY